MKATKLILITGVIVFLDAISKILASEYLREGIYIFPLLSLSYLENTGIAFGIPLTGMLLKILTLVLISGIIWYYWKRETRKGNSLIGLSYALILGGALGNAWERIFRGYVTDFIAVPYFSVFNIADSSLCFGVALMLFLSFRHSR